MTTLVKRLKATVGESKCLELHISDIPIGEVEILILKRETLPKTQNILSLLPKHKLGKVLSSLSREEFYTDAR